MIDHRFVGNFSFVVYLSIFRFKSSQWPSGKVLGGSSRINFNIHFRGHVTTDYLTWQSGRDWSKDDVLYYFEKYEKTDTSHRNGKYIHIKNIYNNKNYK